MPTIRPPNTYPLSRQLELLDLLAQASRTVDELAHASGQSTANTSQHLQALHAAGLVARTREGTSVRYRLAGDDARALWVALRDTSAARLAEVERAAREYLGDEVDAIGRDELLDRLSRGDVVLVDIRPQEEFEAGHIDGARSTPIVELERRLAGYRPNARSSPTAADRSAPTRTRPSGACAPPDARRGGWRRAGPNGASGRRSRERHGRGGRGRHARRRLLGGYDRHFCNDKEVVTT